MPTTAVLEREFLGREAFAEKPKTEGPRILLDPSALPLLPGDITMLTQFLQFAIQDVLQEHIPAVKIEIRGSVDPEDDTRQLLVRLWIRGLTNNEIRHYYQEFGTRVDTWAASLPEAQRLELLTRISFQARREANA